MPSSISWESARYAPNNGAGRETRLTAVLVCALDDAQQSQHHNDHHDQDDQANDTARSTYVHSHLLDQRPQHSTPWRIASGNVLEQSVTDPAGCGRPPGSTSGDPLGVGDLPGRPDGVTSDRQDRGRSTVAL
jgi:hypothetical protein